MKTAAPALTPPPALLAIPSVVWPTVALSLASFVGFALAAWAGTTGLVPVAVAVAVAALADWAAFTLMHEATHGLVGRRHPLLNQLVGEVAATMLMCRFNGFRQLHLRHHRHANDGAKDPDDWAGRGPSWLLPLRWATSDLHYWFEFDRTLGESRIARRVSNASLVVALFALIGLGASGFWLELLLFWVLPARIALFASTYFFDYLPHQRPYGRTQAEEPCRTSAVLRGGPLMDWILLGHTMHLVHHLFPTAPWYRLRAVYRTVRPAIKARGGREVFILSRPRPYE